VSPSIEWNSKDDRSRISRNGDAYQFHAALSRAHLRYLGLGVRVFNLAYLQTFGLLKQDEFVAAPCSS